MGHDRDTSFYVATVTFLVEDRLFRVPRAPFEQESSVFLDMFSIPQGDKVVVEGLCDENPIRLDGVTKDDFEQLLKALFCRQNGSQPPLPDNVKQWTSVLKLSTMWDFQIVRQSAIRALDSLQIDPVDRVALAQQYDIQEWLVPALNQLAKRLEPISFEEGCRMGFDTALKLASVRERISFTHRTTQYGYTVVRPVVDASRDARVQSLDFSQEIRTTFSL